MMEKLSVGTLSYLLECNFGTGELIWKNRDRLFFGRTDRWRAWNKHFPGKSALTAMRNGYRVGAIFNHSYSAHRVIFAMYHGRWPANQVDHINGIRTDNRIVNLRDATRAENTRNSARYSTNTSGVAGVTWNKRAKKWKAQIVISGKQSYLGYFSNLEDARRARKDAEAENGYHPNHGREPL